MTKNASLHDEPAGDWKGQGPGVQAGEEQIHKQPSEWSLPPGQGRHRRYKDSRSPEKRLKPAPGSVLFLFPFPQPERKGSHPPLKEVPLNPGGLNQQKVGGVGGK